MASTFSDFLLQQRSAIDARLDSVLQPQSGLPTELLQAMRYSLLAPGKRLRPLLVLLAAEACSSPHAHPWPAACAVEMVHVYSLIHDDLPAMDDDDLRRGQPTCHKMFSEATAILAGDALLTFAFQTLAENYPPVTATACCADLARGVGAAGMVGGQMDDLAWERDANAPRSLADLELLHGRKTGALICACLRLGSHVAHPDQRTPAALLDRFDTYGRCLGLAFQITDDLLDVEGHTDQTGKRVGKDASRGKLTYPSLLGVRESRRRAEELGQQAHRALAELGLLTERLEELVSFVLTRDH